MSEEIKIQDGLYKIKPAGRHILTIGKDLIKDQYAAIVELVKNAYDAESPYCKISLLPFQKTLVENELEEFGIKIIVKDNGHGMDFETVTEKWMVPSTDDKLKRIISPNTGRTMQGRKGIGRYAVSLLGQDVVLQTIDKKGELTTLYIIWELFAKAKYLDDVDVLIENFKTSNQHGTEIIITGNDRNLKEWTDKQIRNLIFELKKLISPIKPSEKIKIEDNFRIELELGDFPFPSYRKRTEIIEPFPLIDLFDYRISGIITNEGVANLKFLNNRLHNSTPEIIPEFNIKLNTDELRRNEESFCGNIQIDFRVFDKDPASIDNLIERGLKDPLTGNPVARKDARILLDLYNGIGVYRNGFRIRPLGDAGYDWLELDKERVQNPSMRIGSEQVIGFIHIESEEDSKLEEKSARDGLKESSHYFGLLRLCKEVLAQLEARRFQYRVQTGLGRTKRNVENKIDILYDFTELKNSINTELESVNIDIKKKEFINKLISDKEEKSNKIANELKEIIALYQGHATIGKIVNVILHEGSKPLSYFKNQIPIIKEWSEELSSNFTEDLLGKIINRLSVISEQADVFVRLFNKIDPLSAKKRDRKKDFKLRKVIEDVKDVFIGELEGTNIEYNIDCDINLTVFGWQEDFYIVFTNLVDNSIYWLLNKNSQNKFIKFKVYEENDLIIIEYRDNGSGIAKEYIESEIIFEPEFSTKTGGGKGLGLAISGEAIGRNDGILKAIFSETGAYFKLEIKNQ
jgi:signal transduction histidine kinase